MKKFLIGLLTTWITLLLLVLGIASNLNSFLIDTVDFAIKEEFKNEIIKTIENSSNKEVPKEAIEAIEKEINENENLKNLMDQYLTVFLDAISSNDDTINVDVATELESLIDENEEILKEHGIEITEENKKELLEIVSSSGINDFINEAYSDFKGGMSDEIKTVINAYVFVTSSNFKVIMIALIVIAIILIALLKKSFISWTVNLGGAALSVGILMAVILPYTIDTLVGKLPLENTIQISTKQFSSYGYTLIIIGIVALVINLIRIIVNRMNLKPIEEI